MRSQTRHVKQAAAQHRREIARLKRELKTHEKKSAFLEAREKERPGQPEVHQDAVSGARFSARSVRAQRKRLKLAAEDFGELVGVSGQTVYLWEQGKSRPRQAQLASLLAVRGLGKREVARRLEMSRHRTVR